MDNLAKRLKHAREQVGLSQAALAKLIGSGQSTIGSIENGRNQGSGKLLQIARALRVRPEWLETGRGGMHENNNSPSNVVPASIGERRIPLLNYIQAGIFTDAGQNFTMEDVEYLLTDLDLSERAFALQIKGDSMLPDFREGDRIIVDCEVTPRPGDFVVAKNSEQEATFKKYRLLRIDEAGKEVFELVPLNEDYPSMNSEQHHIQIIGTMIEHRKYYRRS
ncbi:MAG: LexA family protein [Paenalcaligenes sp.]